MVVVANDRASAVTATSGNIADALHVNSSFTATVNPNLTRFFRAGGIASNPTIANGINALNEGNNGTANDTISGSILNEGASPTIDDNVFNEGPIPDNKPSADQHPQGVSMPSFFRPVGVGDLQVVQQELQRYELGEIAYVENVLASEFRERLHKQTNEQEVSIFDEEETEAFMEQNLQSSERFELQTAAQEELEKRASIESTTDIKAKYGPNVEVKAGLKFSMENAKRVLICR